MDEAERRRQRHGEYYNDDTDDRRPDGRLREVIDRLRDEDTRQNHRIRDLEDAVAVMRADIQGLWKSHSRIEVALIGHNGQNGIRGTMMEHYQTTGERLTNVETSVKGLTDSVAQIVQEVRALDATLRTIAKAFGVVGGLIATAGVLFGIFTTF